jgi:hypothetical protein
MEAKLKRKALLSIVISYLTNGADVIEFFAYVDESEVFYDSNLLYAILSEFFLFDLSNYSSYLLILIFLLF